MFCKLLREVTCRHTTSRGGSCTRLISVRRHAEHMQSVVDASGCLERHDVLLWTAAHTLHQLSSLLSWRISSSIVLSLLSLMMSFDGLIASSGTKPAGDIESIIFPVFRYTAEKGQTRIPVPYSATRATFYTIVFFPPQIFHIVESSAGMTCNIILQIDSQEFRNGAFGV